MLLTRDLFVMITVPSLRDVLRGQLCTHYMVIDACAALEADYGVASKLRCQFVYISPRNG